MTSVASLQVPWFSYSRSAAAGAAAKNAAGAVQNLPSPRNDQLPKAGKSQAEIFAQYDFRSISAREIEDLAKELGKNEGSIKSNQLMALLTYGTPLQGLSGVATEERPEERSHGGLAAVGGKAGGAKKFDLIAALEEQIAILRSAGGTTRNKEDLLALLQNHDAPRDGGTGRSNLADATQAALLSLQELSAA